MMILKKEYALIENINVPENLSVDEIYNYLSTQKDILVPRLYNYGSMRYKHPISEKNEITPLASEETVIFSGYTGPVFMIDFKKRIIILIMVNACHNSMLDRSERYNSLKNMINHLYEYTLNYLIKYLVILTMFLSVCILPKFIYFKTIDKNHIINI